MKPGRVRFPPLLSLSPRTFMQTIKMFGPSISDPSRVVNRDVPACDEQAYVRAGYKRGSIAEQPEVTEASKPQVKNLSLGSEELPMEDDLIEVPVEQPVVELPAKPRRKKSQN
jgi:hypothetical protein